MNFAFSATSVSISPQDTGGARAAQVVRALDTLICAFTSNSLKSDSFCITSQDKGGARTAQVVRALDADACM